MKYLAILKDSFREALDSKVLYVMVALSTLAILFVASVSLKPLPAEYTMKEILSGEIHRKINQLKTEVLIESEKGGGPFGAIRQRRLIPRFDFVNVTALRGEPNSYSSDYQLVMSRNVEQEPANRLRQDPTPLLDDAKKVFELLETLGLIHVEEIRLLPRAEPFKEKEGLPEVFLIEVKTKPGSGSARLWVSQPSYIFGAFPQEFNNTPIGTSQGSFLYSLTQSILTIVSWVVILTAVIITAFFIPNMLRKGTIDLLLVKPIWRPNLLIYKYLGGLTFILMNNAYLVLGIWLVVGLRTGIWANSFLLMIFVLTFFFAILYAVSTLMGVLTRSTIVAILVTCVAWFLFFLAGLGYQIFDTIGRMEETAQVEMDKRNSVGTLPQIVKVIHFILPRTSDLRYLGNVLTFSDFMTGSLARTRELDSSTLNWLETLTVSAAFIAVMLALACWRFSAKDY